MKRVHTCMWGFIAVCLAVTFMHGADQSPAAYRNYKGKIRLVRLKPLSTETNNWIEELKSQQQRVSCDIKRGEIGGFICRAITLDELNIEQERQDLARVLEHN